MTIQTTTQLMPRATIQTLVTRRNATLAAFEAAHVALCAASAAVAQATIGPRQTVGGLVCVPRWTDQPPMKAGGPVGAASRSSMRKRALSSLTAQSRKHDACTRF
jgi:hypothetical protein